MGKQGFFSTAINGYNKSEVIKFIEGQSAEIQRLNDLCQQYKNEHSDKSTSIVQENTQLKEKIAQLETDLESKQNDKLKQAVLENMSIKEKIEKLEAELEAKKNEGPVVVKDSEAEEQKKQYYDLCSQMGEKLLVAERSSREIIDKAKIEADEILAEARTESKRLVSEVVESAKERASIVYEAAKLHRDKERDIRDSLDLASQQIRELLASVEGLTEKE
ncbi:MAG: hypothetical protein A2Y17_11700 [Clostridiales bacterium GWF2_38_85]|nr:MAG: hypothetical protein A2Y17_11700 [Clostridiales bacterium GWF2_38_85]HBL85366.1 hypothetical protein [Clostridiales bacterium]